jgi:tRNA uridine 5-carboxymethylaminomethyl modification enzyme
VTIPAQIDFAAVGGLSAESKDILRRFQPETIGHANRLPGLTPAAVVAVLRHIKRQQKQAKVRAVS